MAAPLQDCARPEFFEAVGEGGLLTFDGAIGLALDERWAPGRSPSSSATARAILRACTPRSRLAR